MTATELLRRQFQVITEAPGFHAPGTHLQTELGRGALNERQADEMLAKMAANFKDTEFAIYVANVPAVPVRADIQQPEQPVGGKVEPNPGTQVENEGEKTAPAAA